MTHNLRLFAIGLALSLCAELVGRAHDISRSESRLEVDGRNIRCEFTLNLIDLHSMPDLDENGDGRFSYPEVDDAIERIYAAVEAHYIVRSEASPADTTVEHYRLLDETTLRLDLRYHFTTDISRVDVKSTLDQVTQPDHRHFVSLVAGDQIDEAILSQERPELVFRVHGQSSRLIARLIALSIGFIAIEKLFRKRLVQRLSPSSSRRR